MFDSLFRFLFGHTAFAYAQGHWSLLSGWPRWMLVLAIMAGAGALGWQLHRKGLLAGGRSRIRAAVILTLQAAMLGLLLLLLWRPALVATAAVPRQNIAAILIDDSASMNLETPPRLDKVRTAFASQSSLLKKLNDKFQVRMYRFSTGASRIPDVSALKGEGSGTRLEPALADVLTELEGLPLAAVVLVTDGGDNGSTAADRRGLATLKAQGVAVHTVGAGVTVFERDVQVNDVTVPDRVTAGGIVSASVTLHQEGYRGKTVNLEVRDGSSLLQSLPVTFDQPDQTLSVRMNFQPRAQGLRKLSFSVPAAKDETIARNNSQDRVVLVDEHKSRILYLEGEPRWDYKFIRRAVEDDKAIALHSLLRTSANKFYRQGVEDERTLETGFPKTEELFGYEGLILGTIEAGFFSPQDVQSIWDFVSRRGGGLMLLGGRQSFSDGGYQNTALADLFPVNLNTSSAATFIRKEAKVELTPLGLDHSMLQLAADGKRSQVRWQGLPVIGDFQRSGGPKPGAVVLAQATAPGEPSPIPLLVTQRFGSGRTLLLATGSSWRWQMELPSTDDTHELLWRQMLRWLTADSPGPVRLGTDKPYYRDDRRVELRAEVRDEKYQPVEDARVTAVVTAPNGSRHEIPMEWSPREEGVYTGEFEAAGAGTFTAEAIAHRPGSEGETIGSSRTHFERTEGTLEYFDARQNRDLLVRFAEETGGRYYPLDKLDDLPENLSYTKGGITERTVHELWRLPVFFFLLIGLKGAEWGLRKWWGTV